MPVWRPHPVWFREAVASALGQRDCDLELIVVDDGNPEPVADLLHDVDDPRLRVVRVTHGGVSAARNAGVAEARGTHVRFVDADDVLEPVGTRRLLDAADGRTISYGSTVVCDEDLVPAARITSRISGNATLECLLSRFDVRHVSMLFPLEVVRSAGPWDPTLAVCEDWDFVLRCVDLAPVAPVDDVVTLYRRHPTSATRSATARDAARHGQRRVVEKHLDRHPELRGTRVAREAWAIWYRSWACRALDEGSMRDFLPDALALTRVSPGDAVAVWRDAARRAAGRAVRALRRRGARGRPG